jgi:hypothetical protein
VIHELVTAPVNAKKASVSQWCRVLGISRSGLYAARQRPQRPGKTCPLATHASAAFEASGRASSSTPPTAGTPCRSGRMCWIGNSSRPRRIEPGSATSRTVSNGMDVPSRFRWLINASTLAHRCRLGWGRPSHCLPLTSRSSSLNRCASDVVTPSRTPLSTSWRLTQIVTTTSAVKSVSQEETVRRLGNSIRVVLPNSLSGLRTVLPNRPTAKTP